MDKTLYADVILPLALPQLYTYSIPESLAKVCSIGKRVVVQFGAKRFYSAIVRSIHPNAPLHYQTKKIISVLDDLPIVDELHLRFWEWLASYYVCTLGEVFNAAVPASLKLQSETGIQISPDYADIKPEDLDVSLEEFDLISILKQHENLSIEELSEKSSSPKAIKLVKSLMDKGLVTAKEALVEKFKPKTETFIELNSEYFEEEKLKELFASLGKAPKQSNLLMSFLHHTDFFNRQSKGQLPIHTSKKILLQHTQTAGASLKVLLDKGIFKSYEKIVGRLDVAENEIFSKKPLNEGQLEAFHKINAQFEEKNVVLLHGVTSSGKTEIYIHLIDQCIQEGKQALYLLPEIALTAQIINRLKNIFGDKVGVYHSKFSDAERVEIWNKTLENSEQKPYQIILGVRSSVFLPFYKLGLIIVDEEHENTYKQFDPAPRYHARDAAIVLAQMHQAKVLLGTATPSFESYFNAQNQKYGLVELLNRFGNVKMPEILICDMKEARKRKKVKSNFSEMLLSHIDDALKAGEQAILFKNRRGFSPFIECKTCGWVPKCVNCDVSLTYHKHINQLVCHYCSYSFPMVHNCLACSDTAMEVKGFGTEMIEDEIALLFPDAKIGRLDLDTSRNKRAHETIIQDFENQKTQILVGTQMISKGLDFFNVSVVGILNADNMLNYPDFRAFERSYQLMSQVSGRAGRKNKQGKVIIQTTQPESPVIQFVINNDFKGLYAWQLTERSKYKYPPFYRLIYLTLKHRDLPRLNEAAGALAAMLRQRYDKRVLGPEFPMVNRIQNWYIKNIMMKIEKDLSINEVKRQLLDCISALKQDERYKQTICQVNADPM